MASDSFDPSGIPTGTTGPGGRIVRATVSALLAALAFPLLVVGIAGAPSCMGFEEPALRTLRGCPRAIAMLGAPIASKRIGMSCGNAETSDSSGNADWTWSVAGSRNEGRVHLVARESASRWQVQSLTLEVGDQTIDAVRCADVVTYRSIRPAHFAGQVASILGTPGVAAGDACQIDVRPGDAHWPCRVAVRCGTKQLYGVGTTGWTSCGPDSRGTFSIHDTDNTAVGGDPTLDLRAADAEAILTDQTADGSWVVSIRLAPVP